MAHIKFASQGNQEVIDYLVEKTKDIFASKKALNFPCQLAILRKKWMMINVTKLTIYISILLSFIYTIDNLILFFMILGVYLSI